MSKSHSICFLLVVALLGVVVASLFAPGVSGGFILDDWPNIIQNRALHISEFSSLDEVLYAAYSFEPGGSSRPLAMISFALNYWQSGLDPVVFKSTNLFIHVFSFFALALLLKKILVIAAYPEKLASIYAVAVSFIWAIHPLQVSSVLYVVQRMQLMATFFVFLALLSYAQMRTLQVSGRDGRIYGILAVFFGILGFASKEDATLIFLYILILEFLVFRFSAASKAISSRLLTGSWLFMVCGSLMYFLVVVPHFWHWDAYPGRDFSSVERLLTQARVLIIYLSQILLPIPNNMTFFYDYLPVSKGVAQPITTLLSIMGLVILILWAWRWREKRPVFSAGVFIFFAGHFITSNVISLEVAFEHRNYFPIVGILLASSDLLYAGVQRWSFSKGIILGVVLTLAAGIAYATVWRSSIWGNNLRLAEHSVKVAPRSERAWAFLCSTHFELSGSEPDNPHLDRAIAICEEGARALPESAILMNNVVIYKTVKGTVTDDDWGRFINRLENAHMNIQNVGILWVTLSNAERNKYDNEAAVLETIDLIAGRAKLRSAEYLRIGAYIFNQTSQPRRALDYLALAVEAASIDDPAIIKMEKELIAAGRQDWIDYLQDFKQNRIEKDGDDD